MVPSSQTWLRDPTNSPSHLYSERYRLGGRGQRLKNPIHYTTPSGIESGFKRKNYSFTQLHCKLGRASKRPFHEGEITAESCRTTGQRIGVTVERAASRKQLIRAPRNNQRIPSRVHVPTVWHWTSHREGLFVSQRTARVTMPCRPHRKCGSVFY